MTEPSASRTTSRLGRANDRRRAPALAGGLRDRSVGVGRRGLRGAAGAGAASNATRRSRRYERLGIALRRCRRSRRARWRRWRRRWRSIRAARGRWRRWSAAAKEAGNDDAVVRHTQALLAVTDDRATKLGLLETWRRSTASGATIRSARSPPIRAALEIWPDERSIMHRMLELLTDTKQWKQSVQVLARLADLAEPSERASLLRRRRQHPGRGAHAARRGDRRLRAGAGRRSARPQDLRTIDTLVTEARDWKTQERSYRRQIKRMGNDVAARAAPGASDALARPGRDLPDAAQGLRRRHRRLRGRRSSLIPTDRAPARPRRALSPLRRREGFPKAIAEHRTLVARAPTAVAMDARSEDPAAPVRGAGALDEAYAAAAVLVLLGKADADERLCYEQYRPLASCGRTGA